MNQWSISYYNASLNLPFTNAFSYNMEIASMGYGKLALETTLVKAYTDMII